MNTQNERLVSNVADAANQNLRPEIHRIIAQGTAAPVLREGSTRSAALLVAVSMTLLWLSFTPVDLWFWDGSHWSR